MRGRICSEIRLHINPVCGSHIRGSIMFCMVCGFALLTAHSLWVVGLFTGGWLVVMVVMCNCIHLSVFGVDREKESEHGTDSFLLTNVAIRHSN